MSTHRQRLAKVHQQLLFATEAIGKKLNQSRPETFWLRYLSLPPIGDAETYFWDLVPRDGFWSGQSIQSYETRWRREYSHLAKKYYLSQQLIGQLLKFKCHSGSFCDGYHTGDCQNRTIIGGSYGGYGNTAEAVVYGNEEKSKSGSGKNSWFSNLFSGK